MRFTLYAIGIFLILWFLAQVIYILLECKPIEKFWDFTITSGKCNTDGNVSGYSINGASLGLDLVLFVVPIPPLWGLKWGLTDRLCLIGIFMVGAL